MSAYGSSRIGQNSIRSETPFQSYQQNQPQAFSFNKIVYDQ